MSLPDLFTTGSFSILCFRRIFSAFFRSVPSGRCDEIFFRHHFPDFSLAVVFESQITVGENAYQFLVIVYDGNATDLIFFHQLQRITDGCFGM